MDAIGALDVEVQVGTFEEALGPPSSQQPAAAIGAPSDDDLEAWTWHEPRYAVRAFVQSNGSVLAYVVQTTSAGFAPAIPHLPGRDGQLRLARSAFDEAAIPPLHRESSYPANGRWSYIEAYYEGRTTDYRDVVLGASYWGNVEWKGEPSSTIDALIECSTEPPCSETAVEQIRGSIVLSSFGVAARPISGPGAWAFGVIQLD